MNLPTVNLTPLSPSMADDIYSACHGNVAESFREFTDLEACRKWIHTALTEIENGRKIEFAVINSTKHFVGLVSLRDLDTITPEVGLWISPSYQGKGYGTVALSQLIEWAKNNTSATEIVYETETTNFPSKKLAESCGFTCECIRPPYNHYVYTLTS